MPTAIGKLLGRRIRRIRQEKNLTLKQIESKVGVSATHISEIERGKTSPTIGALEKIASALDVPPSHLIDVPPVAKLESRHRADLPSLLMREGAIRLQSVTNRDASSEMSIFFATIDGSGVVDPVAGHRGEEFCYVLEGFLEVSVSGQPHVLRRGDSIHFKASQSHHIRNLSPEPVRTLWAVRPKLFV
ncbi:MAG: cupin domain-containing protein [Candidatus Eisenbacteria bacterium]|uniref:Cupin domain-containing protein n=1 Tax=Eiseniibacteriota bacterium TaxID=2212470 RepID=A0A956SD94_UNCEI|nr:cupin domain-containing protein [Candidatus Eisenbacteria bacterium]MCB9464976.1 helix-turn-helix transcriptional regulator [Candidatus Eisenbacteria bacterium]